MSPTSQKKGPENIPAKTVMHVSNAAMTAAGYASAKNPAFAKKQRKMWSAIMNRISCYFERASDFAVGLFLLFTGLALTLVSFTIIPVLGLFIAIPVLVLAIAFLAAKRSKECALIAQRTKKIFSS
jgi:hypothetical protein